MWRVYEEHNPAKLEEIDTLLAKYRGKELLLLAAVESKYVAGESRQRARILTRETTHIPLRKRPTPLEETTSLCVTIESSVPALRLAYERRSGTCTNAQVISFNSQAAPERASRSSEPRRTKRRPPSIAETV